MPMHFSDSSPTKGVAAMTEKTKTVANQVDHLPIVEGFLHYLIDERHFSPYTSRCYGVDLRQFIDHLCEELGVTLNRQVETDVYQRRRQNPNLGGNGHSNGHANGHG